MSHRDSGSTVHFLSSEIEGTFSVFSLSQVTGRWVRNTTPLSVGPRQGELKRNDRIRCLILDYRILVTFLLSRPTPTPSFRVRTRFVLRGGLRLRLFPLLFTSEYSAVLGDEVGKTVRTIRA